MSETAAQLTEGDPVRIRFEGIDADRHEIDMALLAESMRGLSRIIGVSGNFIVTGRVLTNREKFSLKVVVRPPEAHCFEIFAWLKWINDAPLMTTVSGGLFVSLVCYICKRAAGQREEMKQLRGALDVAIRELGHRDQAVIDRLLGTIDRMADNLRPAVKQSIAPIGESSSAMTIGDRDLKIRTSLGEEDKAAILSEPPAEVGEEGSYSIKLSELDMETGSCKVFLEEELEERIGGRITDPAFSLPNNLYVMAMAAQKFIEVTAKPVLRAGAIERLFISNAKEST